MLQFIKEGILANIRADGRRNHQTKECKILKSHLLYTSGSCKLQGETLIYTGIKLELDNKPSIKVHITSLKKSQRINYLEELIQSLYCVTMDSLRISEKRGWTLIVECFLMNPIDEAYLQDICQSIREAMLDLRIPILQVTKNVLTDEEEYELKEGEFTHMQATIPRVYVIGQEGKELVRDMSVEEFHAVERKFIIAFGERVQVRSYHGVSGFNGEDVLKMIMFIKSQQ